MQLNKRTSRFRIALSLVLSFSLLVSSCTVTPIVEIKFSSLFETTDYFIDKLDSIYEHYDAFGKMAKDTSDGKYTVTPIGRLIVVKKKSSAGNVTYSEIADALSLHYKSNRKVNSCFENNGGTVTIDCRK